MRKPERLSGQISESFQYDNGISIFHVEVWIREWAGVGWGPAALDGRSLLIYRASFGTNCSVPPRLSRSKSPCKSPNPPLAAEFAVVESIPAYKNEM